MANVCRWVNAPELPEGRFLVPGCWSRVVGGDGADCHCPKLPKRLPKEARVMAEAIASMPLDKDQLDELYGYIVQTNRRECR